MGHISPEVARRLVEKGFVTGVKLDKSSGEPRFCESCVYAKATRKPVSKARGGERATDIGGEIHSDLWGPAPVESLEFLCQKSEAFTAYKAYEARIRTQHDRPVKILHSDRGGEYFDKAFVLHLKNAGTATKMTVHDMPQHNGVARFLWAEAVRHAVWVLNRTSTKALDGMTPYEAVTGKKPDLKGLQEWGEKCWVRLETKAMKLGGRVREGRWIGFDETSNGSRVYWTESKTVSIERNVYFDTTRIATDDLEEEEDIELHKIPRSPAYSPTHS